MRAAAGVPALQTRQSFKFLQCTRPLTAGSQSQRPDARQVALQASRGDVMLMAESIGHTHDGEKILFDNLTFTLAAGDKLAVIGPNGCGKSTLLRIMAGTTEHDSGTLSRNKGARVGYLPQDPQLPEKATVLQAVLQADSDMARASQRYQKALAAANSGSPAADKELELAMRQMEACDAWEIDSEAGRLLEAVGVMDVNQPVNQLSGGQRKRVALASALMGRPDLLIMDEPTNHLDVRSIRWMQQEIKRQEMALVVVSHDRYFLEESCDRMLELDMGRSVMHNFGGTGSYDKFKEARSLRRESQANAAADAKTLLRKEAVWMSRQPQGRQAKARARQDRFYELTDRSKAGPKADLSLDLGDNAMARQGNKVVKMLDVTYIAPARPVNQAQLDQERSLGSSSNKNSGSSSKDRGGGRATSGSTAGNSGVAGAGVGSSADGTLIINNFTYDFQPGERLGIVGRNGTGKTTLLELITGRLAPSLGTVDIGETAHVGYFTQYPPNVREDMRIIDYIREVADNRKGQPGFDTPAAVPESPEVLLEKLGFARPRQYQKVASLSGGERRRLHLATVLIERPNVLVLDEPTNDLDIASVEVLEDLLAAYKGVLLCVSHDRAFMDNVADKLLVLRGDGPVRVYEGIYSEYLAMVDDEEATAAAEVVAAAAAERAASGAAASASQAAQQQQQQSSGSAKASSNSNGASSNGNGASSNGNGKGKAAAPAAKVAVAAPVVKKQRKLGYYEAEEYKKLGREMETLGAQREKLANRVMALGKRGGAAVVAELQQAAEQQAALEADIEGKEERFYELAELAGDM